jgi:DNA-binding XRE family transcriptional regulator
MTKQKLHNYLRPYRRRAALSVDEVAFLLGSRSGAKVSRHERGRREPNLKTALAYEVIFQTCARELFAGVFVEMEARVRERTRMLIRRLQQKPHTPAVAEKLQFLAGTASRTSNIGSVSHLLPKQQKLSR